MDGDEDNISGIVVTIMSNEGRGVEPLPNNQQVIGLDCNMEDQRRVTHLDDVSESLPNTQQVIEIVSDMKIEGSKWSDSVR